MPVIDFLTKTIFSIKNSNWQLPNFLNKVNLCATFCSFLIPTNLIFALPYLIKRFLLIYLSGQPKIAIDNSQNNVYYLIIFNKIK